MEQNEPVTTYDTYEEPQLTKPTLMKYLFLTATMTVVLSAFVGVVAGAITGGVVSRFFPQNSIQSQTVKVTSEQSAVVNAVKKANPAVVSIVISQDVPAQPTFDPLNPFGFMNGSNGGSSSGGSGSTNQIVGAGSGFIISSNGLILTNKHVASSTSSTYSVSLASGKTYTGTIVAQDPTDDIALMKINATNLPVVSLGSDTNLELGQTVIAIGNALGQYANTVSAGVLSGVNRTISASDASTSSSETLQNVLQTDAQINPGNSGGPLLDINGNVIGINTAVDQSAQGIGFAIPISQAMGDIKSVEASGKITKPELGVRYTMIDSTFSAANPNITYTYGAYVTGDSTTGDAAVISGSPADKAGIKSGDIILSVDGTKVEGTNTLSTLIDEYKVGDTITLQVVDNGKVSNLQVKLDQSFQ